MNDLAAYLRDFGQTLFGWLGPLNLWTAALLAGAMVLDRALARHARASWRIALYAPIGLRVLLPLGWTIRIAHAPRVASFFTPLPVVGPRPAIELAPAHLFTWQSALAVAYIAVAALLALRAIVARVRLSRAIAGATPLELERAAGYRVVVHETLGPMAVGLLSPRVVLPKQLLERESEHALPCVLAHEIAHMRRRDAWLSAAMQVLAVLAWPVLPLWLGVARVRQLIELACDEVALSDADAVERRKYGHALLDIAEWPALAATPLGAGELQFGSTLRARIEALASQRHWPRAAQVALVLCVSGAFAACSSVGPTPTDVTATPTVPPEGAPVEHRARFAPDRDVVMVNGIAFRTEDDLVAHCPSFMARGRNAPRPFEWWARGPVNGIPADEVALCRSPELTDVLLENFWSAEARNSIGQIAKDIATAYEGGGAKALCPGGSPEPPQAQARGAKYQPTSQDWTAPGWACLRFSMDQPFYFQYSFTTDATSFTITAHAQLSKGDHGVDVTMVLHGSIEPDGVLAIAPSIEETWKDVP